MKHVEQSLILCATILICYCQVFYSYLVSR
jgi:hypothetical protein